MQYPRRQFIKKAGIIAVALALPRRIFATLKTAEKKWLYFDDNALIDLHCHPSLKMYLIRKNFAARHFGRGPGIDLTNQQEDAHEFDAGKVRAIVATHYLVERGVKRSWLTIKYLWGLFWLFQLTKKVEAENAHNTDQAINMIDTLERGLNKANNSGYKYTYEIVYNYKRLDQILSDKTSKVIPVIHAIEGAHALGRNLVVSEERRKEKRKQIKDQHLAGLVDPEHTPILKDEGKMQPDPSDPAKLYIANMERLWQRGVCMITLGHFFQNDIAYPIEGIDPDGKKKVNMHWWYDPAHDNKGLTTIGKSVVSAMLDKGVIVDMAHTTPQVRQDVFEINAKRSVPRPLVFSHVGLQDIFDRYDFGLYPNYKYYNVCKEEIEMICNCGNGVIGIIPEMFWLAGSNRAAPLDEKKGIPYMIETMKAINRYTPGQQFENIAIGTDFDGLATNPTDLFLNSQLPNLYTAMMNDPEIAPHIQKITHCNALRLLQYGWEGPDKSSIS